MADSIRAALERLVRAYDSNEGMPIAEWIATARAALAEPVSLNCWLDDDGPCPTACVFDDPSECVTDCTYAAKLEAEQRPKTCCKHYRVPPTQPAPEPVDAIAAARTALAEPVGEGPSDEELDLLVIAIQALAPHQPDATTHNLASVDRGREILSEALSRWARPTPPAEGEVAELVEWLKANSSGIYRPAARAAELLQQQHPTPVPVSEGLPEPNTKVLAHYFNALGNGRTICAIWVPVKSRSDDADFADDDFTEYDEEDDKYYWPEGWYEAIENWDDLGWVAVNEGEVAYWQPLPKWPAKALPLPQGEVEK